MARERQHLLPAERRAVTALAAILSLRMLGFYAVLPILSTYAASLPGATSILIGMSVGVYALTQSIFQIPLGLMSDRLGRPRAIVVGLLVFAAGSFTAAAASNIWWLLVGRLLQGSGAVASVLIAFAADLTRPVARTRAMGFLGLAIGGSLALGMGFGPLVASHVGVSRLFALTGVLSMIGIVYVLVFFRHPPPPGDTRDLTLARAWDVLRRRELVIVDVGVFVVHLAITCVFVVLPFEIERHLGWGQLWRLYPPVIVGALLVMFATVRRADHPGWARPIMRAGGMALATACFILAVFGTTRLTPLVLGIALFIIGIAAIEPILPALVTRFAPPDMRGTATGVFNVHQFAGSFAGGFLGGNALDFGLVTLFAILTAALTLWTLWSLWLPSPFRVEIARRREERSERKARVLRDRLLRGRSGRNHRAQAPEAAAERVHEQGEHEPT